MTFIFPVCLVWLQCLLLSGVVTMARWFRHWKPCWVPYGDSFRKAFFEEWEQEAHASEYSGQESEYRWISVESKHTLSLGASFV